MTDPVAVGVDAGTLLFMILAGMGLVGVVAYSKFNSYKAKEEVKHEIRTDLLDREQTKEIKRIEREIDDIKRTK
ncbi:hypothetical protein Metvu_1032 [Methanocaldococcus vulcanius M7]|uniref:Uncharacterized protein n=1 Tax=Methanocaldococcus vulcanius (strain ATCC 700851 / DSM 12094 / M7) TaxID=579137 RepID=C9RH38_METVM|nr:hypothetical protein [Methanocaldococcus vulcanius]ACX72890.1 hypothetical protein Metvu_1032 [Methanocaldococcus vulcanius M7]